MHGESRELLQTSNVRKVDERRVGPVPANERTISFRFLSIIFRVLRLEVSVYNVYITNQFFLRGERE
jgi:hypothetical protein